MIKPKIPFRINYPLEILNRSKEINFNNEIERERIFRRNLFYYRYKKVKNPFLEKRHKLYFLLAKEISKFIQEKYPKLEIQSISVFGSSLYSENPRDFDFLILVKGNIFILEEREILLKYNKKTTKYSVGISIKGIDNFSLGIFDLNSKTPFNQQNQIIDRTVISLFKRHIPLIGYDFLENREIFMNNVYAQTWDLLSNTYNLYYLKKERPYLDNTQRAKKILSRVYEAVSYLESLAENSEVKKLKKEIYFNYISGKTSFDNSKKIFNNLKILYTKKVKKLKKQISKEISFKEDNKEIFNIFKKTTDLLNKKKIGKFLPVVSKIVDSKGETIAFSKRIKQSNKSNIYSGSIHAEICAINYAKSKDKINWKDYTLYCSLEPCGACAEEISKLGIKKVVYCVADPLLSYYGRKREPYTKKRISFYRHNSSELIAKFQEIYSELYNRKNSLKKDLSVLDVLKDKRLKENIAERLKNYWKKIELPYKWINPILNILLRYSSNEDIAIMKIRKRYSQITKSNNLTYSKKLKEFRSIKVKNLANRIKNDILGEIIVDVGGRNPDFIEQIVLLKKEIKKAYLTDIDLFSSESKNHKIKFLLQEDKTKIPFAKNAINTFILSMVLHHLKSFDQRNLIKNMVSSLKHDGKIILIEDSYPESKDIKGHSRNINNFLRFTPDEKKRILSFYDWFGNRLMRNRDNTPLFYKYRTMEEWKDIFEGEGLNQIKAKFIHENPLKPDIFSPKAILVFQKNNRDKIK